MRFGAAFGIGVLAATVALGGPAARAADMPLYNAGPALGDAPAAPQLTFGSGWYLRGDASFGPEDQPKLLTAPDGSPTFDRNATTFGYGFGVGAGYKFNDLFRADVTGDYLDPFSYSSNTSCGANCSLDLHTEIQRFDGLVNGYVDLGTWWGISPYVGAGAGVSGTVTNGFVRINGLPLATGIVDPSTGTLVTSGVPTRTDYRFAWAAMAGISYPVTEHMLLDLGYRYLDLGKTTVSLFPSTSVARDISANQVRVGLRYMVE